VTNIEKQLNADLDQIATYLKNNDLVYFKDFKDFNQTLNENLLTLDKESKEIIIMGDTNVDYMKNNDQREIKSFFTNNGFKQLLKTPKRITPTSATLIDIIHANNPQNISHITQLLSRVVSVITT
jgi:exonuclease III